MIIAFLTNAATSARKRTLGVLEGSETLRRFVSLASWTLVSFALEKGAMIVVVFLLARILGAEDYGRLTLAQGLVSSAQIFVVLGAGTMLARYIPAMREQGMERAVQIINLCASVLLCTATVVTAFGVFTAHVIATTVLDLSAASPVPYFIVGWVLLTAANSLLLTVMLSFERGRAMGLVSLVGALLSVTAVPLMAPIGGLGGVIGAMVVIEVAKCVLFVTFYKRLLAAHGVSMLTPASRQDIPLLWRFGLPVFLTSALWAPTVWLAQLIIKTSAPSGLVDVGAVGLATSMMGIVVLFSSLTNQAAFPILSSLEAQGNHAELKSASLRLGSAQAAMSAMIGLPLAAAMPWVLPRINADFEPFWPAAAIIIAVGVVTSSMTAFGNYLVITGHARFITITMAIWSLTLISGTALLSDHGANGYAVAIFTASLLRFALIVTAFIADGSSPFRRWTVPFSSRAGE